MTLAEMKFCIDNSVLKLVNPNFNAPYDYRILDDELDVDNDKLREFIGIGTGQDVVTYSGTYKLAIPNASKVGDSVVADLEWNATHVFDTPKVPSDISKLLHIGFLYVIKYLSQYAATSEVEPAHLTLESSDMAGTVTPQFATSNKAQFLIEAGCQTQGADRWYYLLEKIGTQKWVSRSDCTIKHHFRAKYKVETNTTAERIAGIVIIAYPLFTNGIGQDELNRVFNL